MEQQSVFPQDNMKTVYLDNAATTQVHPEVVAEMTTVLADNFGNASSTHSFGRHSKNLLELSRKKIAKLINATAQEIVFTSGGTESDNWVIRSAVKDLKVKRIITSKIEHHAVLHSVDAVVAEFGVTVDYVKIKSDGCVDVSHLVQLLSQNIPTLVSLMHVNNEIGTFIDLKEVGTICREYQAYFHSDTIQSLGKVELDMQELPVDFICASAHKFHGPKGIGFIFIRKGLQLNPIFFGGEQEKGLRAGTESIHNIVGMAKALELSYTDLPKKVEHITNLKQYAISQIQACFPEAKINGKDTFYNLINICLPLSEEKTSMILFQLDMKGVAVSRGSACQSGSTKPSHVLAEVLCDEDLKKPSLRISFSCFNTKEDVDYFVDVLKSV